MEIVFKYRGEEIPNELRLLTKSLLGYSSIDDCPLYTIETHVKKEIVDDLLFDLHEKGNHIENIKLFLRRFKASKILNGTSDRDMDKFVSFIQFYNDLMGDIIVLQSPMSLNK